MIAPAAASAYHPRSHRGHLKADSMAISILGLGRFAVCCLWPVSLLSDSSKPCWIATL